MVELVPDLERIIGPQPHVPETSLVQAQARFDLTLARFLSVFARAEHPLVLFLDDLQWADPATLHALGAVLRLHDPGHLLVIGAYRTGEVGPTHPLSVVVNDLREGPVEVRKLELAGLKREDVRALVADTLHRDDPEVHALADLVAERTAGNPFFVDQFLRGTPRRQAAALLAAAWAAGPGICSDRELGHHGQYRRSDGAKARTVARRHAGALQLAACVGNQFELEVLAAAAGVTPQDMRARLGPALRERLLSRSSRHYPSVCTGRAHERASTGADQLSLSLRARPGPASCLRQPE